LHRRRTPVDDLGSSGRPVVVRGVPPDFARLLLADRHLINGASTRSDVGVARHGLLPAPGNNLGREKCIGFGCLKRLRSHRTEVVAEEVNALGGGKVVVVDVDPLDHA
jgi:hypothetical protein